MGMDGDLLRAIKENLPLWEITQALLVFPPLDTESASYVWIRPAMWEQGKDKILSREAVEASGWGPRTTPGDNLQDVMDFHGYKLTRTHFGLRKSPLDCLRLRIYQNILDTIENPLVHGGQEKLVIHYQLGAFMVHLVAQEGTSAFHAWRGDMINAVNATPVLAGYFRTRPGTSTTEREAA